MNKFILSFFLMLISTISYASFPIVSDNIVIEEGANFVNTTNIDPFNTLGWIVLGCLVLARHFDCFTIYNCS